MTKHFPDQKIPNTRKARTQLHKQVASTLLQDPVFAKLDKLFCAKLETHHTSN